jgi:hypothetical protein
MKVLKLISLICLIAGSSSSACSKQSEPIISEPIINEIVVQADDVTLQVRIAGNQEAEEILIAIHGGPGNSSDDMISKVKIDGGRPNNSLQHPSLRYEYLRPWKNTRIPSRFARGTNGLRRTGDPVQSRQIKLDERSSRDERPRLRGTNGPVFAGRTVRRSLIAKLHDRGCQKV